VKSWDLVWEARSFSLEKEGHSPWLVCITYSWQNLFLAREVFEMKPTSTDLWNILVQAIQSSETNHFPKPKTLRVEPDQGWEQVTDRLKGIGIKLIRTNDLDYPDGFLEWMDSVWQDWQRHK
jgi:hypothetical protein